MKNAAIKITAVRISERHESWISLRSDGRHHFTFRATETYDPFGEAAGSAGHDTLVPVREALKDARHILAFQGLPYGWTLMQHIAIFPF